MNPESKQIFSVTQQIELRRLQLEVQALEKQIENILAREPKLPLKKSEPAYSLNSEDSIKHIYES